MVAFMECLDTSIHLANRFGEDTRSRRGVVNHRSLWSGVPPWVCCATGVFRKLPPEIRKPVMRLTGLMPSTGLCRVLSAPSALEVRRALVLNSGRV